MRLGRYPWIAGIPYYMERKQGTWNPGSTAPERERKLKQIGHVLEDMKGRGLIGTTDPRHLPERDVLAFASYIRRWDPGVQKAMLTLMKGYLAFFKNHAVEDLIESGELHIPRSQPKPIRYIQSDDLSQVFSTVETMKGWTGSTARGLCALYFGTGVRPSELRLAELEDLDLRRSKLFVRHPKGEGNWASPEWVDIIRGDVLPLIDRYIKERTMKFRGRKLAPLFPVGQGPTAGGFYCDSRFCDIAARISELSGVKFTFKDFRSTLCTLTINNDPTRVPLMRYQLRHGSEQTTEDFYAAIDRSVAVRPLHDLWREAPVIQQAPDLKAVKPPLIDSKFEVSGYA